MKYVKPFRLFKDLLKTTTKHRSLLGLSVGPVVAGLAVFHPASNQQNMYASPLSLAVHTNENTPDHIDLMASEIQLLASELSVDGFVVACPNGNQLFNHDAIRLKAFMYKLSKTGKFEGMKYTYWQPKRMNALEINMVGIDALEYECIRNRFAAASALQNYLYYMNGKHGAELKLK